MKVTALSPQFVNEAPPGVEGAEAEKTANELHLKLVRPETPPESAGGEQVQGAIDHQTREGLKRLSQFIHQGKSRLKGDKKRRVLRAYIHARDVDDPRAPLGANLDRVV